MKSKLFTTDVTFLHPGEAIISNKNKVVYTILGSCVAITMFNPRLKMAAIVHSILPESRENNEHTIPDSNKYKYIDGAISELLKSMETMGIKKNELEIKIFGGSNLISAVGSPGASKSIGWQNVMKVKSILNDLNLKVTAFDVGGMRGRKIYFITDSGIVYLSRLKEKQSISNHMKT